MNREDKIDCSSDKVGIIMGSRSDLPVMKEAAKILEELGIDYEINIVSAHRTPDAMYNYAKTAEERGIKVIIAGAGGSAHLPGMVASLTHIPVIGVPIKSQNLDGIDSLLSIVQMPAGVPVATVSINGAENAGLLAARILSIGDSRIRRKLALYNERVDKTIIQELNVHNENE
jgi:5-(carboxyamino)imidazole ribonucleotide mutase